MVEVSRTLLTTDKSDMGLYSLGSLQPPSVLGMRTTAESFYLPGIFPVVIEMLNNCVKLGTVEWAVALSIQEDTPSGPGALLVSTASNILRMSSSEQRWLLGHRELRTDMKGLAIGWRQWRDGCIEILSLSIVAFPAPVKASIEPIRKSGIWVLFLKYLIAFQNCLVPHLLRPFEITSLGLFYYCVSEQSQWKQTGSWLVP